MGRVKVYSKRDFQLKTLPYPVANPSHNYRPQAVLVYF